MYKIFIDGSAGTTGLRIYERLADRKDIQLLTLPEEKRKDASARKEMINSADIVFLCLPDDASREAVAMTENENVVIIEDIIDTGRTLNDVVKVLKTRNPASLRVITLLDKPSRRVVDFKADLSLFTIPDLFVIGYGLDCGERYRNLPYIAEYKQ